MVGGLLLVQDCALAASQAQSVVDASSVAPPVAAYDDLPVAWQDVLSRYRGFCLASLAGTLVTLFLLVRLFISNRALAGVTERLRLSEAKLMTLVNSAGCYMYLKDGEYRYQFGNRLVCDLFQTTPEALIGLSDADVFDPATLETIREIDRQVIELGLTQRKLEIHIAQADGISREYLSIKTPIRDAAGHITGLCGISTDITGQGRAQGLVEQWERRFRNIASRLPGIVYQVEFHPDGSSRVPYISENVSDFLGLSVDDFANGLEPVLRLAHPDDRAGLLASIQASITSLKPWLYEYRFLRPDGETRWLGVSSLLERDASGVVHAYGFIEDISEQQNARQATHELQQRLRKTVYRIPGVIFQLDQYPDGHVRVPYVSEGLASIYGGLQPEALRDDARPLFERCHPEDYQGFMDTLDFSLKNLQPWFYEFRIGSTEGEVRWLRGNAVPEAQDDGLVTAYGFITDVTEQQMAQSAIHELQNRISEISARLPGVIYQLERHPGGQTLVVYASPGVEALCGVPLRDLQTRGDAFFDRVHADDRERVFSSLSQCGDSMQAWLCQYRIQEPNDSIRWLSTSASPNRTDDGVLLWHGYVSDVTEEHLTEAKLRESEDKLRSLYRLSPLGIALTDMSGRFLDFNASFMQIFGYTAAELKALDYWEVTPREYEARENEQLASMAHAGSYGPYEKEYIRKDGSRVPVRLNGVMMTGTDGADYIWSIIEDMTGSRAMLNELERSNAELEQFAYAVSHDMRQPLRMVSSYLQIVARNLKGTLDEDTRTCMEYALDGAQRMDQMILSLLDYSRTGRADDAMVSLSSRDAVNEALAFLKPEMAARDGQVEVTGVWPDIEANPDEMTRLLQNLIGNALKYHPADRQPRVVVRGSVTDSVFRVEVEDNGIGIDPTQISRLFHVFSRLQARSRHEGVGVGLALCRKIVEHHHGQIGVTSAGEGLGCTFWFELPLKVA